MKLVIVYSCANESEAQGKAAELEADDYRLDIFEGSVDSATVDFRGTGGDQCFASRGVWIVAGTKDTTDAA